MIHKLHTKYSPSPAEEMQLENARDEKSDRCVKGTWTAPQATAEDALPQRPVHSDSPAGVPEASDK